MSAHASYNLSISGLDFAAGYFLCYVVGFETTLIHRDAWSRYSKYSAGTFSLTAASYGTTFAIVVESLLEHGTSYHCMHRFLLIKKSCTVDQFRVVSVDFCHRQQGRVYIVSFLIFVVCLIICTAAYGWYHVPGALVWHRTNVIAQVSVTVYKHHYHSDTNVRWCHPHAIRTLIGQVTSHGVVRC